MSDLVKIVIAIVIVFTLSYKPRDTSSHYTALKLLNPNMLRKYSNHT